MQLVASRPLSDSVGYDWRKHFVSKKAIRDPRVFFTESPAYYRIDNHVFYSPKVPDFNGGAKIFRQSGELRYGGSRLLRLIPESTVS